MDTLRKSRGFWAQGEPFVWITGAAVACTLALTLVLVVVVFFNGLGVFWPHALVEVSLKDGSKILGEQVETDVNQHDKIDRIKYKVGNREDGPAFRWVDRVDIAGVAYPADAFKLDRMANLNYFGFLKELNTPDLDLPKDGTTQQQLDAALTAIQSRDAAEIAPIKAKEAVLAQVLNDDIKYQVIDIKYRRKLLLRDGVGEDAAEVAALDSQLEKLQKREKQLKDESYVLSTERTKLDEQLRRNTAVFVAADGKEKSIALLDIVRFTTPNNMGFAAKVSHYLAKVWELLSDDPREANQDGGLFPAIFGTVLLVFLMAVTCFPLGVLAGIYLGEYAKEGPLVRLVRVAVNNLAGIPSIVYGIFGLGFFIYLCGGILDDWLYPARVDASEPVFGQGCILWASLTLGLLTIPVVIVSTEEALRALPRGVSESSYALGATKFQTLWRVLIPMASPGIMTGFILAMARAAGEVAPLMITGAVKSAPVPVSGSFPYLHLDRQFMHLGFHIFDISCKSPNVEATKPMVYVTTLLLLVIVITLSSLAIWLRNRMRKRYQSRAI